MEPGRRVRAGAKRARGDAAKVAGRTFSSLQIHYNYRLYFFGQVVSVSGTWMQSVAQAWFIVSLTHSALAVGLLAVCQFGPYAVLGLFGGAIADRYNQRKVMMGTQSAYLVVAGILAGLTLTGHATEWEIFFLAAVSGTVQVLDTPVRQAFTIQMVGRDELPNAIALNSSLFNASRIIGPAIGGVLIAVAGVGICFLINAFSYLAVIWALAKMRASELFPIKRDLKVQNLLRGAGEGIAYAWRNPAIRSVLLMMLVIGTISINFNVLLPVVADQTLMAGSLVFGVIFACFGLGALVGALFSAALGRASQNALLAGGGLFSVAELVLAPLHNVLAVGVTLLVVGFAFSLYASQSNTNLQVETQDRLRGRVLALYGYVFFGTAPLGGLLAGWLAQQGGTQLAFLVAGLAGVGATAYGVYEMRSKAQIVAAAGLPGAIGKDT